MGDKRRFAVTAAWIRERYPRARTVADVAGGSGRLSLHLLLSGVHARVVDPRVTGLSRRERKRQRRGDLPQVEYLRRRWTSCEAVGYDLVAGLHPDGATAEIAAAALLRPVCVVPCCNYGWGLPGDPADLLRRFWDARGVS